MRTCLALLAIIGLTVAPLAAETIRVWDAPLPGEMLAASPAAVVELFDASGYDASTVSTDDLLDADALAADRIALLVVPTLGSYPADGLDVLADYLRAGGRLMTLGGVPFSSPLVRGAEGWQQVGVPTEPPADVNIIADFDTVTPHVVPQGGEDAHFTVEVTEDDGDAVLRASLEDLQQWQYVDFAMTDTGDASFSVLHFRAKGDANTPVVGLEMNEADGSRWKYVVALSEDWRDYTIYIPHFLSYATEARGGEGDYLHPERLRTLSFGITKGMVGKGPHAIWLDDIERWQFEPPSREVVPQDRSVVADTARAYGNLVKVPPGQQHPLVALFDDAARFENEELAPPYVARRLMQYDGWSIDVPTGSGPAYQNVVMSPKRTARVIPLLERQPDGGTVAGLVQVHDGDLAGATIAFFALDENDLLESPLAPGEVLRAAEYTTRVTRIADALPDFTVEDGGVVLNAQVHVAAPSDGANTTLTAETDDDVSEQQMLELAPHEHRSVAVSLPAGHLDPAMFRLALNIDAGDAVGDSLALQPDVRQTLIDLCDFFVAQQDEDGVIAGAGFVDERAVRALLVMYDETGKREYLDAAIRWGDNEIAMQREDGGYRMGYGITPTSEVCYVADGGEIAIGMARLVSYVPDDRRDDYIQSLRDYFDYRESFRLDDGKITVGWVFSEQFSKAGGEGRREIAFRSDKSFPFVASCTLAAASAWQEITDDPDDRAMAVHDARWYLEDVPNAAGVSAEAAQWAHYFIDDPDLRADLAQRMKETLVPGALDGSGWWYSGGGRTAVTLSALAYYYAAIEQSPEALAGILRGVYRMTSPHSPASVYTVMADDVLDSNEWRYLAYSAVGLAEVLRPTSTMAGIDD